MGSQDFFAHYLEFSRGAIPASNGIKDMAANFSSGWFGNGQHAWHGQGVVTQGTLPPRNAFEQAGALFEVEKRECFFYTKDGEVASTNHFAIARTDNEQTLGIVSEAYTPLQNSSLLRMSEYIREEADMDCVIVLGGGAKIAFTATLRDTQADIKSGDPVVRRIVGYLGHDGHTGCGAMFTNVRVVCQNTLASAIQDAAAFKSISHSGDVESGFDALIQSIDVSRRTFKDEVEEMQEMTVVECGLPMLIDMIEGVYGENISDSKAAAIQTAFTDGLGADTHSFTLWGAVNAITEIETSPISSIPYRGMSLSKNNRFHHANFGTGRRRSLKAMQYARQIIHAF